MEKKITFEDSRYLKKIFLLLVVLFFFSNIATVYINHLLNRFLISPEFHSVIHNVTNDLIVIITTNFLPFPIVVILVFFYLNPILKDINNKFINEGNLVRIINLPIIFSLLSALGWIFGTINFQSQFILRKFTNSWYAILESTLFSLSMAVVSFVFCFYLLDFSLRRFIIPRLFTASDYNSISKGFRPNLKQRFILYIVTASLIPGFFTFRLLQIFNNGGDNVYGKDIEMEIILIYFIIGVVIFSITTFLTNSVRSPLEKMKLQAEEIKRGNFSKIILVDTRDEIGDLSTSMNSMTISLAEKEMIKDSFGRMVDPSVRDYLLGGNMDLGGAQAEAVILFSDLVGFTPFSENRSPEEVVSILNRYFGLMSNCVSANGGIINKFIGDAIYPFFSRNL